MTDVSVTLWPPYLCPSEGHKHGVSIQSSINLGDTLMQITREWKAAKTWFLAMLLIYQSSIKSQILDFIHWTVTIFSFDHMTGENRDFSAHHPLYNFWGQYDGWRVNQTKTKDPKHNWYFGRNVFSPALDPQQDCKQEWSTADVGVREKPEYFL